jgi:hypothetical protein
VEEKNVALLKRIEERILIETAFNDPDETVALLIEARDLLADLTEDKQDVDMWQQIADRIFLGKDL